MVAPAHEAVASTFHFEFCLFRSVRRGQRAQHQHGLACLAVLFTDGQSTRRECGCSMSLPLRLFETQTGLIGLSDSVIALRTLTLPADSPLSSQSALSMTHVSVCVTFGFPRRLPLCHVVRRVGCGRLTPTDDSLRLCAVRGDRQTELSASGSSHDSDEGSIIPCDDAQPATGSMNGPLSKLPFTAARPSSAVHLVLHHPEPRPFPPIENCLVGGKLAHLGEMRAHGGGKLGAGGVERLVWKPTPP